MAGDLDPLFPKWTFPAPATLWPLDQVRYWSPRPLFDGGGAGVCWNPWTSISCCSNPTWAFRSLLVYTKLSPKQHNRKYFRKHWLEVHSPSPFVLYQHPHCRWYGWHTRACLIAGPCAGQWFSRPKQGGVKDLLVRINIYVQNLERRGKSRSAQVSEAQEE